jgi:uncharacterized repeat protein (TIGR01451 family)
VRFRFVAVAAAVAVAAGCHDATAPDNSQAATDAAATLLHLADSLSTHGGSTSEIAAYRSLATLLIGTGRLSTVTISVDGTATEFLATAQEIRLGACPLNALCAAYSTNAPPDRSMIAWQKSNPRRVVQLFAPAPLATIVSTGSTGVVSSAYPSAKLLFLDGAGALYGGSPTLGITASTSSTPCAPPTGDAHGSYLGFVICQQADFTVSFDGTALLIPLEGLQVQPAAATSTTPPAPSHDLGMPIQHVKGAHIEMPTTCAACPDPAMPGAPPFTSPWHDSLSATLTATVGTDVTFTFTVKNTGSTAAVVRFNDGQQYDFRVWNSSGAQVWHWGTDKGFTLALTTRTLAAGESVSYVEHWARPAAGAYHAMGYLTSASHAAAAFTTFSAP